YSDAYIYVPIDYYLMVCGLHTILYSPDDFNAIYIETPRDPALTPFGSSGCSETFQSSGHVSVINGIYDAAGVRIYEEPARPEKIKAALEAKARGEELKPEACFVGTDFEDELQEIIDNPICFLTTAYADGAEPFGRPLVFRSVVICVTVCIVLYAHL